jgi:hypothetical protein
MSGRGNAPGKNDRRKDLPGRDGEVFVPDSPGYEKAGREVPPAQGPLWPIGYSLIPIRSSPALCSLVACPERGHAPQSLDDGRELLKDKIDLFLRVVDAQAEPDATLRCGWRESHGKENMGGFQGAGRTG